MEPFGQGKSFLRHRVFFFLCAVLILCYGSVVYATYGFSDDYSELLAHLSGDRYPWAARMASGRPINAALNDLVFLLVPNIGALRYLRLLSIFAVAGTAWVIYLVLTYAEWDFWQAVCAALIIASLPSFQVYVSFALTASFSFSMLTAGLSVYFIERSAMKSEPRTNLLLGGSVLMLALSVLNYQPAAMFFWVLATIVSFSSDATPKNIIRRLLRYFIVFAPAMGIGLCAYILGKRKYGIGYIGPERAALNHDLIGKLRWFLFNPLLDALNLINLFPHRSIAVAVLCFISVGLFLYFQGRVRDRLANMFIAGLLVPVVYLPNLVIAENFSPYRTQIALTSLIAIYAFLALKGFVARFPYEKRAAVVDATMFATASICLFVAAYHVQVYFTRPQSVELEFMRQQLVHRGSGHTPSLIWIFGANPISPMAPGKRYDEFGLSSTAQPWAPGPEAILLLRSSNLLLTDVSIRVIVPEPLDQPVVAKWLAEQSIHVSQAGSTAPPDALVVDMRNLKGK